MQPAKPKTRGFTMGIVTMDKNDVTNYSVTEHMRDQRQITIRAVRPDDRKLVIKSLPRLGAISIYRRFFSAKSGLTDDDLRSFTEVDFVSVVQLCAVLEDKGEDWIIAGGRYIRSGVFGTRQRAEIAFMVGDPVQGQGIGSLLFRHLTVIALASGIVEFEAEVLPTNAAMFRVFEKSGYPVSMSATRECVHLIMDLTGGASP
jgi:RimJ/RimL family protein N-acetyltransferase